MDVWNDDFFENEFNNEFDIFFDVGEIQKFKELSDIESDDDMSYQSYLRLGNLYAKTSRFGEALVNFNMAIQLNPKDADLYFHRGIAHFHLGNFDQAMVDFSKALESEDADVASIQNFTGCLKLKSGDLDGALEDIESVLLNNNHLLNDLKITVEEYEELMQYKEEKS